MQPARTRGRLPRASARLLPGAGQRARQRRGARASDRLIGFARVDPNRADTAATEALRALDGLGLSGVFLQPWEETFRVSSAVVEPLIEIAQERGVPVIMAAGYPWLSEGLQIGDLARRFPDVAFIATNGGQINISGLGQTDIELAMTDCPNLSLQTAGVYREDFLEGIVERFGADRLLYASAFPLMEPLLEVERPRSMHVSEEARAAVLGGTAVRLLLPEL
ncbi:MAG: amidohydrolase family protein [Acidobacteria bacterium]|nr:amidohydrolase family protein [Acidobacteriota bacterium]